MKYETLVTLLRIGSSKLSSVTDLRGSVTDGIERFFPNYFLTQVSQFLKPPEFYNNKPNAWISVKNDANLVFTYFKGNLVQQAEVEEVLFHFLSACCWPAELEGVDEILVRVQCSAMDLF